MQLDLQEIESILNRQEAKENKLREELAREQASHVSLLRCNDTLREDLEEKRNEIAKLTGKIDALQKKLERPRGSRKNSPALTAKENLEEIVHSEGMSKVIRMLGGTIQVQRAEGKNPGSDEAIVTFTLPLSEIQ